MKNRRDKKDFKPLANLVNSILTFIGKGIFRSSHARVFLKKAIYFRYTSGFPMGGCFPLKLQTVYLSFWLIKGPSEVFLKDFPYFIIYCVNDSFGGTALSDCFIILSTLFILILHGRKVFWKALFTGKLFINI